MASLLPRNGELFSQVGTAPPPNKDFCQLQVLNDEVNAYLFVCLISINYY